MEGDFSSCQRFKHELNCTARSCRTNHRTTFPAFVSLLFTFVNPPFCSICFIWPWKLDSWSLDCWAFVTCDICDQGGLVRLYFRICWNATWKDASFHTPFEVRILTDISQVATKSPHAHTHTFFFKIRCSRQINMHAKTRKWRSQDFSLYMIQVLCVRSLGCTWTPHDTPKLKDMWAVVQSIVAARTMLTTMPLCLLLGFGRFYYCTLGVYFPGWQTLNTSIIHGKAGWERKFHEAFIAWRVYFCNGACESAIPIRTI